MQIHVSLNGQQHGPYPIDQINDYVADGRLPLDTTMAWFEGSPEWISLREVPGVISPRTVSAPPPPPPPAPVAFSQQTAGPAPMPEKDSTTNLPNTGKPDFVKQGILLLWISLGLGAIRVFVVLFTSAAADEVLFILLVSFFVFAVIAFFIFLIDNGKNWARITITVFFAIGLPFTILDLIGRLTLVPLDALFLAIQLVTQCIAIIFFWQKSSNAWFRLH